MCWCVDVSGFYKALEQVCVGRCALQERTYVRPERRFTLQEYPCYSGNVYLRWGSRYVLVLLRSGSMCAFKAYGVRVTVPW